MFHNALTVDLDCDAKRRRNVIIQNTLPTSSWTGMKYDLGLYRNERRITVKEEVHVGDQAIFHIPQVLYFSVARNVTVESSEVTSMRTAIDMTRYQSGLSVTLKEMPGGGQYIFSIEAL